MVEISATSSPQEGLAKTARLDAYLRLQLEEQNQSRHHENLRDRAVGNMSLVNGALLAILGAIYQAKLDDSPTILEVSKYIIPAVVLLFGAFTCWVSLRHSVHAERHWQIARLYRRRSFDLLADGVAEERASVSSAFVDSDKFARHFERYDNPGGRYTRTLWMVLPGVMAFAGLVMIIVAAISDWRGKAERPPQTVRVDIGTDGTLSIAPATLREWFELQRRSLSAEELPPTQSPVPPAESR